MDDTTLARIEQQRLELEDNIAKLRKSLRHWQALEIDYEGLKEEYQGLPEDTSAEKCLQAAKDFKPELVDDNELEALFNEEKVGRKRPSQLVDIFTKRVDYVTRNISTIRRQLSDAEKKRNALLLAEDPNHQDDAGLPLSEITEELDEDGKVIASRVQTPGKDAPGLLDVLQKAGISDVKNGKTEDERKDLPGVVGDTKKPTAGHIGLGATNEPDDAKRKDRITELSDSDDETASDAEFGPTNPDDTEEDAALRQEMLKYGLGEVGAIVAKLDLEDAANPDYDEDDEDDDYLSDYDEDEDLYTDESEDDKGATKNPVISERYRRQMEALSKKHGISAIQNLGPDPKLPEEVKDQIDRPPAAEAARSAAIARAEAVKSSLKNNTDQDNENDEPQKKKKKVAFAPSLDIATDATQSKAPADTEPIIHPVGDTIVERTSDQPNDSAGLQTTSPPKPPSSSQPKKISKFKAARSSTPQTPLFPPPVMDFPSPSQSTAPASSGPPGQTISHTLVERPASDIPAPTDPTDLDEALHRREIAVEYQKMRNRKIHEQGGYVRGGAAENYGEELAPETVVDDNTGKPRKMSRFKAARLQHEGASR